MQDSVGDLNEWDVVHVKIREHGWLAAVGSIVLLYTCEWDEDEAKKNNLFLVTYLDHHQDKSDIVIVTDN